MAIVNRKTKIKNLKSFTLIELLVVVTIIAVLISILLPALGEARENSRRVMCLSNVHQIGVAFEMYANDNNRNWPRFIYGSPWDNGGYTDSCIWLASAQTPGGASAWHWEGLGKLYSPVNYVKERKIFFCPGERVFDWYLTNAAWDGTYANNIFSSYCVRGWIQSYNSNLPKPGKILDQACDRALVSCFFMYSPPTWPIYRLAYHKKNYPVLFGGGDAKVLPMPSYVNITSLLFNGTLLNVWGMTSQQYMYWDWFDVSGR